MHRRAISVATATDHALFVHRRFESNSILQTNLLRLQLDLMIRLMGLIMTCIFGF
jgi:hypothetical protein